MFRPLGREMGSRRHGPRRYRPPCDRTSRRASQGSTGRPGVFQWPDDGPGRDRMKARMPIPYMSLFSGAGGLDEGLHRAGFRPLFCCESDRHAMASLRSWAGLRKVSPVFRDDVTAVEPGGLAERLGLEPGRLPLLAGGPPCQAFSLIGKRGSLDDRRGPLLYEMLRFAKALRPRAVLVEQVKGLVSAKGACGRPGGALAALLEGFEELGYSVGWEVLNASDYGVPQRRERLFIVASTAGRFAFPAPTHADAGAGEPLSGRRMPLATVGDAIADLPPPAGRGETPRIEGHVDVTPARDAERIKGVPEGECLARQAHLPESQRGRLDPRKDTTKFRRLSFAEPSLTLRCGEAFYHPVEDRYLTPRECMRIHTFPDDQKLAGPIRGRSGSAKDLDQHRQVANAVPPLMAKALGESILKQCIAAEAAEVA